MQTIPYSKFRHGRKLKCKIKGVQIDDAKISVDSDGYIYICSNEGNADGCDADNKLGYRYSWKIFNEDRRLCGDHEVTDLIFLDRTIEDVQEGDVVEIVGCDERTVLGRCGGVVFLSHRHDSKIFSQTISIEELKFFGYKLKQEAPTMETGTEVSMGEIAEWRGIPVEQLRIKE